MMAKITTCEAFPTGILIPWNINDWESPSNESEEFLQFVDVDSSLFCPKQSRYLYFPGQNAATFETIEQFCQMFGGSVVNTTFRQSGLDEGENIYKFRGDANPILVSRVYETEWICEYDLRQD